MEFEDEHDEEQEEEEEDEDDEDHITIPPPSITTLPPPTNYDSGTTIRPRANSQPQPLPLPVSLSSGERARVRYRDCLKNHAVSIGGHAVDGCGEFMPAGEEGTLDGLKCAACNCHRNFHRKEIVEQQHHHHNHTDNNNNNVNTPTPTSTPATWHLQQQQQQLPYYRTTPSTGPPSGYLHVSAPQRAPLAAVTSSGEIMDDMSHPSSSGGGGGGGGGSSMSAKKRFRTKFSQEQKDKMYAFAEKLGWRIQKHDEAAVQQFCAEVNVRRQVLKVWMHNNKHTLGKKP